MGKREFGLWIEDSIYVINRIRMDNAFREFEDNEID